MNLRKFSLSGAYHTHERLKRNEAGEISRGRIKALGKSSWDDYWKVSLSLPRKEKKSILRKGQYIVQTNITMKALFSSKQLGHKLMFSECWISGIGKR